MSLARTPGLSTSRRVSIGRRVGIRGADGRQQVQAQQQRRARERRSGSREQRENQACRGRARTEPTDVPTQDRVTSCRTCVESGGQKGLSEPADGPGRGWSTGPVSGRTGPRSGRGSVAERVGFEPTKSFDSALFKSAAINRSATSPAVRIPAATRGPVPADSGRRGFRRRPASGYARTTRRQLAHRLQGDLPMTTTDAFLVQRMGSEEGPFSLQDLATQARAGVLKANTMVKRADGTGSWFLASELPGVFSDKDWLATLLISFFVGWFGIDRFYLGYTGAGRPQAHHLRRLRHLVPRGPDPHRHGQARRLRASTAPPHVIDRRAVAAVLVAGAVVLPGALVRGSPVICPFRRVTGLPCPACGLTQVVAGGGSPAPSGQPRLPPARGGDVPRRGRDRARRAGRRATPDRAPRRAAVRGRPLDRGLALEAEAL